MKILFLGDSITEGVPGVSYIAMIKDNISKLDLVNRGIGGDTVSSLLKRVKKMDDLSSFDQIILFIGVNDVFGKLTNTYKVLKILRKQKWALNESMFQKQYNELINIILSENKNIVIIPPLLIGEDINNKWNTELLVLINIVKGIAKHKKINYLDIYNEYKEYLENKEISNFLPIKITKLLKDMKILTDRPSIDLESKNRGLHLTLDGVHLNSVGAQIICDTILEQLKS